MTVERADGRRRRYLCRCARHGDRNSWRAVPMRVVVLLVAAVAGAGATARAPTHRQ